MITYDNQGDPQDNEDVPPLRSRRIVCYEESYESWSNKERQTLDELDVCHDESTILSEKPEITFEVEISLDQ